LFIAFRQFYYYLDDSLGVNAHSVGHFQLSFVLDRGGQVLIVASPFSFALSGNSNIVINTENENITQSRRIKCGDRFRIVRSSASSQQMRLRRCMLQAEHS
jgi:hypothetical protein